ncbi:MAG: lipid A export permease/ATP-binding protein MsbA [Nitrospinae bacterium]|nr:lipid A export permease/ATP-binding protein MsbA [Nitrospinota bacterium]
MDLYRRLLGYLRPYRGRFAVASLFMVAVSATTGATAMIIQPILDDIFMAKDKEMLALLPLGVVGIYLVRGVGRYVASSIMQVVGQRAVQDIRNDLFARLQRLSLRFFADKQTGQIMSRLTNDVQQIQDAVSIVVYDIVRESLTMIALLGVVYYRDWKLATIALLVIPLSGGLIGRLGKSLRKVSTESQERMADMNATLLETFTGVRVVQAFGMETYEIDRFEKANALYFETLKKTIRINELSSPLLEFIGAFGIAAIIAVGGAQVIAGETTVGAFFSFLTALFMLYQPISKLSRANNKVQQAMAAAARIFEMMDTPREIVDRPDARPLAPLAKGITFERVSFAYDGGAGAPVLTGIDLAVARGQVVALVGSSGAGKSTLVNLVPRFFDVTGGAIRFDDTDIRDVTIASLRAQIGIVTQEVFLFADTIRNNIAYGHADASDEAVTSAATAAFAHDFISALPEGYDTFIGERGVRLSGGQRQRLSIARALMKNPAVMILDEATSALDTESEKAVQAALANLMKGRTTLVIAHRLSTILNADRIVTLDRGRIVETGTHEELLANNGPYRRLFELQFADMAEPAATSQEKA